MAKPKVGDTWRFVSPRGDVGKVWLAERHGDLEFWKWVFMRADGSGLRHDWTPTRRKAVEECSSHFGCKTRFVRAENVLESER